MFDKKTANVHYYDKKGVLLETFTHKISGSTNCYGHMRFDGWTIGDYRKRAPKGWNKYFYAEECYTDNGDFVAPFNCYEYRYEKDYANSLNIEKFNDMKARGFFENINRVEEA
jgi:hypothetical protein